VSGYDMAAEFLIGDETIKISSHAFERFKERLEKDSSIALKKDFDFSDEKVLKRLEDELKIAARVKRKNSVQQIIKYGFKLADYRSAHGWIYVI